MKSFLKIIPFLLFLNSCGRITSKQDICYFDLTAKPVISDVRLSDLGCTDIEYISLETNDFSTISDINQMRFGDGYFITHFFSQVLAFRNDGSFASKIGIEGRGPYEFTVVHDVDIDPQGKNIYLADGREKKFFIFSQSGQLLSTFPMPIDGAIEFKVTEDGILIYYRNHSGTIEKSYILIDTTGVVLKTFSNKYPIVNQKTPYGAGQENIFYMFNNLLIKKEVFNDTVYIFNNDNFKPHLILDVGDRLLTTKARAENDGIDLAKNFITPLNLFEFSDFVYYEFIYELIIYGDDILAFIGSKSTDFKAFISPKKGIINDFDGGPNIWPKTTKDDNTLVSWVNALQLKNYVASDAFKNSKPKYPEKKKELENLVNSLEDTDNPVLMMVRLKKKED